MRFLSAPPGETSQGQRPGRLWHLRRTVVFLSHFKDPHDSRQRVGNPVRYPGLLDTRGSPHRNRTTRRPPRADLRALRCPRARSDRNGTTPAWRHLSRLTRIWRRMPPARTPQPNPRPTRLSQQTARPQAARSPPDLRGFPPPQAVHHTPAPVLTTLRPRRDQPPPGQASLLQPHHRMRCMPHPAPPPQGSRAAQAARARLRRLRPCPAGAGCGARAGSSRK